MPAGTVTPSAASTRPVRAKIPSSRPSTCSGCCGIWPTAAGGRISASVKKMTASGHDRVISLSGDARSRAPAPNGNRVVDDRCYGNDTDRGDQSVGQLGQHEHRHERNQLDDGDDLAKQSGPEDGRSQRWNNFGD